MPPKKITKQSSLSSLNSETQERIENLELELVEKASEKYKLWK